MRGVTATGYKARRMAGRCRSDGDRAGPVFHAVDERVFEWGRAFCGAAPKGRSQGWSEEVGALITCRTCVRQLERDGLTNEQLRARYAHLLGDDA